MNILAGVVLLFMVNDIFIDKADASILSRIDGLILMAFFVIFMSYTIGLAKAHKEKHKTDGKHSVLKALLMTGAGIVGLAYGGQWVVNGAIVIAKSFGLSEALIGLTIVAVGTSLPELATSAVAAYKHKTDIAIGNIVGSNLFNIFWVLGLSAVIKPMPFNVAINADIFVFLIATIMLFASSFAYKKDQISRLEGGIFVAAYVCYIIFLIIRG